MKGLKRKPMSKGKKTTKKFNKSVAKTKNPNLRATPMRGGFRF